MYIYVPKYQDGGREDAASNGTLVHIPYDVEQILYIYSIYSRAQWIYRSKQFCGIPL